MSVWAWLDIKFVNPPTFDGVLNVLLRCGWTFGETFQYYPPGAEHGDWETAERSDLEAALNSVRLRERGGEELGFDLFIGESGGLFHLNGASLSFKPGIRARIEHCRTSDVTFHLRQVLVPLRAAFEITSWKWEEDA